VRVLVGEAVIGRGGVNVVPTSITIIYNQSLT
jgi:hypothetical protein